MEDLKSKVAIVTGASRGVGAEVSRMLAEEGARVALMARGTEGLKEMAAGLGSETVAVAGDVSRKDSVLRAVEAVLDKWGRVDILVNNAGVGHWSTVLDLTEEEWDRVIDVNLKGVFLMSQAVLPAMLRQGEGDIVNVSSVLGHRGGARFSAYCASKFGVEGFSESLYAEVRDKGIRVFCVSPAMIDTGFRDGMPGRPPYSDEEKGMMLTPADVAGAILWVLKTSRNMRVSSLIMDLHRMG